MGRHNNLDPRCRIVSDGLDFTRHLPGSWQSVPDGVTSYEQRKAALVDKVIRPPLTIPIAIGDSWTTAQERHQHTEKTPLTPELVLVGPEDFAEGEATTLRMGAAERMLSGHDALFREAPFLGPGDPYRIRSYEIDEGVFSVYLVARQNDVLKRQQSSVRRMFGAEPYEDGRIYLGQINDRHSMGSFRNAVIGQQLDMMLGPVTIVPRPD